MTKNYVLIDYENVNDANLDLLATRPFDVMVFVGANQTKIPIELAMQMARLHMADYIRISGNGPNALDFHIAFYIGRLAETEPGSNFHVVSKDRGFDPLIRHLRTLNISARRVGSLTDVRLPRGARSSAPPASDTQSPDENTIDEIVRILAGQGSSKPRRVRTLAGTIQSLFKNGLDDDQVSALIEELREREYIAVVKEAVRYNLPK